MPLTRSRAVRRIAATTVVVSAGFLAPGVASANLPGSWTNIGSVPSLPAAQWITLSPDNAKLYVSQWSPNQVSVVDAATLTAVGTIAGITRPSSSTLDPSDPTGRYLYVASQSVSTVSVVDTTANTVVRTLPAATNTNNPKIVMRKDGSGFYTTDYGANPSKVVFTDVVSGSPTDIVLATPGGGSPGASKKLSGMALSPDGRKLFVSFYEYANVSGTYYSGVAVVDTTTNTQIGAGARVEYPMISGDQSMGFGLASNGDGTRVYLNNEDTGVIVEADPTTGAVSRTISTGASPSWPWTAPGTLNVVGDTAYVSNPSNNQVRVVNLGTGSIIATMAPGDGIGVFPIFTTFSSDGTRFYVANWGSPGSLSVYAMPGWPDAPISPSLTAGDGRLTVSYSTPADNGSPITDYEYSLDDGATWKSAGTTGTSFVITGLTNGTKYTVLVRAVNAMGKGAASTAVTSTPEASAASSSQSAAQAAAEANPKITVPAAVVTRGRTLTSTVNPSVGGSVRVTATLAGRTACTVTKKATKAGRMKVTCTLNARTRAIIKKKAVTLKVTARLTDAKGKTATASRNVRVARYVVRTPVTG